MDQDLYYSSQFAEMAAVSVRTLRYYDKVGLLSPSRHTAAGHRLYSKADLVSLQHILALKFLGFSLEEIRVLLQAGPQRLEDVLAQQRAMLQERRAQLDTIIQAIEKTERLLQSQSCNWESIAHVIQVIQMEQKKDWQEKYFTPEQQQMMQRLSEQAYTPEARQKLAALHPNPWTKEDQKRVDAQYLFIKQELGRLVAQGTDPASADAQNVAHIKTELLFEFTQGDPDIKTSLGRFWESFEALPQEQKPIDMSVYTYTTEEQDLLDKALEIYKQSPSA
ncbi:MAG: MerR family transcriptional regulator [Ktedonobacteraceae bacterium]|nr:MerR family transcriptional regulator [Ktedonobacteraceae bacterium]